MRNGSLWNFAALLAPFEDDEASVRIGLLFLPRPYGARRRASRLDLSRVRSEYIVYRVSSRVVVRTAGLELA